MSFESLKLSPDINRGLESFGYEEPFPVQTEVIPLVLAGKDLRVQARTGSGKTIAFLAPIIDLVSVAGPRRPKSVRALILAPTRELAVQIGEVAARLGAFLPAPPRIRSAVGGRPIERQRQSLAPGVDLLVATPGRLLDLLRRRAVDLGDLRYLVLDEADKMLELGFSAEINEIRALLPAGRQSLLFSATMKTATISLVHGFLRDPVTVDGEAPEAAAAEIEEGCYLVAQEDKGPFLRRLLAAGGWDRALVFVSSGRRADNVARKLVANGIQAAALHGDKSQGARAEALAAFKAGRIRVLVATDLASRGLDIEDLPCVINYELPRSVKDYVHRIGRTGRAGRKGLALSLVSPDQEAHLGLTEKFIRRKIPRLPPA